MKSAFTLLILIGLSVPARAQMRDNRETQLTCNNLSREISRERALSCEVRESSLGPSGRLDIEPGRNGGITVKGWAQNSVLVRARLELRLPVRRCTKSVHLPASTMGDLSGYLRDA